MNLGWKLAQVVNGISPDSLLDTYHSERHPAAARALRKTMAQTALSRGDERMEAVRESLSGALADGRASQELRRDDVRSRPPLRPRRGTPAARPSHARPRSRRPSSGPERVFTLLRDARPILLELGEPGALDVTPWANRVRRIRGSIRRRVGAPGHRRGRRPCRGPGSPPTATSRGSDGGHRPRPARRAHHLVRTRPAGRSSPATGVRSRAGTNRLGGDACASWCRRGGAACRSCAGWGRPPSAPRSRRCSRPPSRARARSP